MTTRTSGCRFGSWGHEARAAADGEEGLRIAAEFRPDVVFLDLAMPGMSGLEVALAGHAGAAYEEAARAAGFDHFLAKPTPPEQLLALLLEHAKPGSSQ